MQLAGWSLPPWGRESRSQERALAGFQNPWWCTGRSRPWRFFSTSSSESLSVRGLARSVVHHLHISIFLLVSSFQSSGHYTLCRQRRQVADERAGLRSSALYNFSKDTRSFHPFHTCHLIVVSRNQPLWKRWWEDIPAPHCILQLIKERPQDLVQRVFHLPDSLGGFPYPSETETLGGLVDAWHLRVWQNSDAPAPKDVEAGTSFSLCSPLHLLHSKVDRLRLLHPSCDPRHPAQHRLPQTGTRGAGSQRWRSSCMLATPSIK